jgi:hypothetical protein
MLHKETINFQGNNKFKFYANFTTAIMCTSKINNNQRISVPSHSLQTGNGAKGHSYCTLSSTPQRHLLWVVLTEDTRVAAIYNWLVMVLGSWAAFRRKKILGTFGDDGTVSSGIVI